MAVRQNALDSLRDSLRYDDPPIMSSAPMASSWTPMTYTTSTAPATVYSAATIARSRQNT